jgi:hypothetical protein
MQGDVTSQRRWEAYDKLGTFAIYVVGTILVIQVGSGLSQLRDVLVVLEPGKLGQLSNVYP